MKSEEWGVRHSSPEARPPRYQKVETLLASIGQKHNLHPSAKSQSVRWFMMCIWTSASIATTVVCGVIRHAMSSSCDSNQCSVCRMTLMGRSLCHGPVGAGLGLVRILSHGGASSEQQF